MNWCLIRGQRWWIGGLHWSALRDLLACTLGVDADFVYCNRSGSPTVTEPVGTGPQPDGSTFKGPHPSSGPDRGCFWLATGAVSTNVQFFVANRQDVFFVIAWRS